MEQPQFYTVDDIAKLMKVSTDTVRLWLRRRENRLPSYRVGREYRVKKEEFETWLQSQQYDDLQ